MGRPRGDGRAFVKPRPPAGATQRKDHNENSPAYHHDRSAARPVRPSGQGRLCLRRHRIHAREHLLAGAVPDSGRRHRGGCRDRPQGAGPRPFAAARPDHRQRRCAEGIPRWWAGCGDHLQPDRPDPAPDLRHPDRDDGDQPVGADRLFQSGRIVARFQRRQGRAFYRLGSSTTNRAPDRICHRRRYPSCEDLPENPWKA